MTAPLCRKHPHSSTASAERCFAKERDRRIRKKTRSFSPPTAYRQVAFHPPKLLRRGPLELFVFFGAEPVF